MSEPNGQPPVHRRRLDSIPSAATELPLLCISDIHHKDAKNKIEEVLSCLWIDDAKLERIRGILLDEMRLGLDADPERKSSLLMENTFIKELADGTEHGTYLALDLGGTNFRVILLTFEDGSITNEIIEYYEVPEAIRLGPGENLFSFLADCIADFLTKRNLNSNHYYLGFSFSFPMVQKGLTIGLLQSWTKSFNCSGIIGKDVVKLFSEALAKKKEIKVTINSILNDTTGTLVKGSFMDHRCAIGMILGTGHNVCYVEKVENVKKWIEHHNEKEVIIDTEWGAFGDNGVLDFLKTEWDIIIDKKSILPNSYTFEKYISGKYLGELIREALHTLAKEGLFCRKSSTSKCLQVHGSFKTKMASIIESEAYQGQLDQTKVLLTSWGLDGLTDDDVRICQYVCQMFSYRGALLVSFVTATLLERMDRHHCTIAIDGSLFEHHPRFRPLMERLIAQYAPNKQFSLILAPDGSGKGAGIVAAVVDRLRIKEEKSAS